MPVGWSRKSRIRFSTCPVDKSQHTRGNGGNCHFSPSSFANAATKTRSSLLKQAMIDRKSTRLNSSHITISYAVFCLKKKKKKKLITLLSSHKPNLLRQVHSTTACTLKTITQFVCTVYLVFRSVASRHHTQIAHCS